MKKFSKIFETKEKILDVIGIEESDIKDICQDLIDEYDFTFKITPQWISKSGSIYYKANQASETYPSLLVSLERQITDRESGEPKIKKDPRSWNGGVYYEDDADLIKVVYQTIRRLESMLDKGEIKVFYSIRSVNDIQLRITTPIEQTKLPIDVENVVRFIENIESRSIQEQLPCPEYKIERTWSQGNRRSIQIAPLASRFHSDVKYLILMRVLKEEFSNNSLDLIKNANYIIEKLRDACTKGDAKRSDIVAEYYDESYRYGQEGFGVVYIKYNDMRLVRINSGIERVGKAKIKTSSGIFKDKFVDIKLNKLEMEIEILAERGYGDND
jgi:hypothetical protein